MILRHPLRRDWMMDVGGWLLGFHHKPFEYNSSPAPASGWSGGTLDKPWTCLGTIEPSPTPVFHQPHLSSPLHPPLRRLRSARTDGVLPGNPGAAPMLTGGLRNLLRLLRLCTTFGSLLFSVERGVGFTAQLRQERHVYSSHHPCAIQAPSGAASVLRKPSDLLFRHRSCWGLSVSYQASTKLMPSLYQAPA